MGSNGTSNAKAATAPRKQISGSAVKKAPSRSRRRRPRSSRAAPRLAQSPHSVPRRPRNARPPLGAQPPRAVLVERDVKGEGSDRAAQADLGVGCEESALAGQGGGDREAQEPHPG